MPLVKNETFKYRDENNQQREEKIKLKVDVGGTFYADMPAFIYENVKGIWGRHVDDVGNHSVKWRYGRKTTSSPLQVSSGNLDVIRGVIKQALEEYSSPVEQRDWMIVYRIQSKHWLPLEENSNKIRQCFGVNNLISPHSSSGITHNYSMRDKMPQYDGHMVGVSAMVVQRLITTRGSFEKTVYLLPSEYYKERGIPTESEMPCDMCREVNEYFGLAPKHDDSAHHGRPIERFDTTVNVIHYDPEKLRTIMAMVHATGRLAEMIDQHFGEGELPKVGDVSFMSNLALPAPQKMPGL